MDDTQYNAIMTQLGNIQSRLNGIDRRITVNAEERLAAVESLHDDLDQHMERNHEKGGSKTVSGGVAGVIAAIVIAVYEALKRVG